jgi:hypothetical protein
MSDEVQIDWSRLDAYPEDTVTCRCGGVYRSHVKVVADRSGLHTFSRKPCPNCGSRLRVQSASSDPEVMTL